MSRNCFVYFLSVYKVGKIQSASPGKSCCGQTLSEAVFRQEKEVLDQQERVLTEQIETLSTQIDVLEQRQKGFQGVFDHAGRFTDREAVL